ncbi:MAG TPA: ComEC/Rec2 family competence protein [Pyrinomonadaceae bacterium]|nr:ComEC/Rec2 family competence protein [Pyrinomonadaceae bacterium]
MGRARRGGGCALVFLIVVGAVVFGVWYKFFRPEKSDLPPASGEELRVHVLDVGQGDAVLVIAPGGKAALIDAGNPGNGKKILAALEREGVQQIDLFVATHAHADHIGAADEVIKGTTVRVVLDSKIPNATKNYEDFLKAIKDRGVQYVGAEPGQTFDMGGGAILSVLAPIPPPFTKDQLRSGGNEPNANSVVLRLDYGDFSMLLTGDAEAQTEARLIENGARLEADVLKVGHHGSKYATSETFLRRGGFKAAVISAGYDNRYGHPSPEVLARLKAAGARLYRTDLQGEIKITTKGKENDFKIDNERRAEEDLWAGREAKRDDSSRSGFIQYGDFGPAPRNRNANNSNARNANNANAGRR